MIPPDLQKSSVIRYRLNKIIFTECRSKKKREKERENERARETAKDIIVNIYKQQGPLDDNRKKRIRGKKMYLLFKNHPSKFLG